MTGPALWSVILAGGEGERLRALTTARFGGHRPKQYCAFVGTRSMLQHTLDRADRISDPARKVTVIARGHERFARPQLAPRAGIVVSQPANRDTAAGVYLPLAHVLARDPGATVAIFPSDHFVFPEARFLEIVRRAVGCVERMPERVMLLGVRPDGPETDFGWVVPGADLVDCSARNVTAFVEKPSAAIAAAALAAGGLWNTMVIVANVRTLWKLGGREVPDVIERLAQLRGVIGTSSEDAIMASVYEHMPAYNFSRDVLERCARDAAVLELDGVRWSDWGRPERITDTLALLKRGRRVHSDADVTDGRREIP